MNKKIDVSIIIVHYKVKQLLIDCLESIYKSTKGVSFEIIVVDNDDKKTIGSELKRNYPEVNYIKSRGNIGYGAGNNLGAKKARGEFLFFVNPDTDFLPGLLEKLVSFIKNKKNVGAVSPILLTWGNKPQKVQGSQFPSPINAVFSLSSINRIFPNNPVSKSFFLRKWNMKKPKMVDVFPGTAFLIRKDIFEKTVGFDENLFLFFEESDLAQKIKKIGFKNYIVPDAKIKHFGRASTKKRNDIQKIYRKSQFYYFRKWYGLFPALTVQFITSIGKNTFILAGILLISFFLRTHRLDELMIFIGDQGWFYLSARDIITQGSIPFVGITSSHTWIHQGALWTYILAILFKLFNFNPLAGAYFTAILGAFSVFLVYKMGSVMFSTRIGVISSFLYATSPLIIFHSRMSYHTSPIPFFTILFIYSVYKWIKGNILFFPISIFLLAVLYNLELATFGFTLTFTLIFLFGVFRKTKWGRGVLNLKIILYSILAFLIPMFPMIIYDLSHGFPQTLKFIIWVVYRIAVFLGYPPLHPNTLGETWTTFFSFNSFFIQKLIFFASMPISFVILISSLLLFIAITLKQIKSKQYKLSYLLIFLLFYIPFIGFVLQKTNSEAYLPIFFPTIMIIVGISFDYLLRHRLLLLPIFFIILFVGISNSNLFIKQNYFTDITFNDRVNAAKKIIKESNGKPYNLIGEGAGSQYESFTMNHEFLTWYFGHGPSDKREKLQFIISEQPYKIEIERKEK